MDVYDRKRRAQVLVLDVLMALMLRSFHYSSISKGMPVKARLPVVRWDDVNGRGLVFLFSRLPNFRLSCSSFRMWIMWSWAYEKQSFEERHVKMWRKVRQGWFTPKITIIRPSQLDVGKATFFKMSFLVNAQMAVTSVVTEPKHNVGVRIVLLFEISG